MDVALVQDLEGQPSVDREADVVTNLSQDIAQQLRETILVFDDENRRHAWHACSYFSDGVLRSEPTPPPPDIRLDACWNVSSRWMPLSVILTSRIVGS